MYRKYTDTTLTSVARSGSSTHTMSNENNRSSSSACINDKGLHQSSTDAVNCTPSPATAEAALDPLRHGPRVLPVSPTTGRQLTEDELISIRSKWEIEQREMKEQLQLVDPSHWGVEEDGVIPGIHHIGGVDISFIKDDPVHACAALVVLTYPQLDMVYKDCVMVEMTEPYIAGYLAFREVPHFVNLLDRRRENAPHFTPDVLVVDGNGVLHYTGFGVACHLGIKANIPTIGVAKNLLNVDGLCRDERYAKQVSSLHHRGDYFPLVGDSGTQHGVALRPTSTANKPVYVSPGHMCTMDTARLIVLSCSKYRVAEPTRHADIVSREFLRVKAEQQQKQQHKQGRTKKQKAKAADDKT